MAKALNFYIMTTATKKYILLTLALTFVLAAPLAVLAQESTDIIDLLDRGAESAGYDSNTTQVSLPEIVGRIVRVFLSLTGLIFISYTIYGGFLWMTAAGNDEKITKAKHIIRNGIIGLIVTFASAAIYYVVMEIFDAVE